MTVVIAGGSGFLGTALAAARRAGGHQVTVLTRQPRRPGEVGWTATDRDGEWPRTLEHAEAVVNLAGAGIGDRRWTTERKRAIVDSRIGATRALVNAIVAARTPPRVLLSASGIGIYGSTRSDESLTEGSSPGSDVLASVCRCAGKSGRIA
jgi:NAD dependent epimerase/dehydratase family enzyme